MHPGVIIGACMIGAACLGGSKRRAQIGEQRLPARPAQNCDALPFLEEEIEEYMAKQYPYGGDGQEVTIDVLNSFYEEGPDGEKLNWPALDHDCPQMKSLQHRVYFKAKAWIASVDDAEAQREWEAAGGY